MRVGDTIENAIWLSGKETAAERAGYERVIRDSFTALTEEAGFIHGPVRTIEKRPGEERVPAVPDHIAGPDVRLLVMEADILCAAPIVPQLGFIGELEPDDLDRLRKLTRKRSPHPLTDYEVDQIIEEIGPAAAEATLTLYGGKDQLN